MLCRGGEVRAIDLESAVPMRSAPKTFSPEAMPPDFALASRGGVSSIRGAVIFEAFDVVFVGVYLPLRRDCSDGDCLSRLLLIAVIIEGLMATTLPCVVGDTHIFMPLFFCYLNSASRSDSS